jgi:hypothetical protein
MTSRWPVSGEMRNWRRIASSCESACKIDPIMECAPWGGQIDVRD